MKKRIISALVGLAFLAVVFALLETVLLNIVMWLISLIAVWELLSATGCSKYRGLTALSFLMALLIPFARVTQVRSFLFEAVYLLILAFFVVLLKNNAAMRIEHFAMAFLFSTVIPVFFSCAVYLRDDYHTVQGGYYLLMALGSAWLCDTSAYFVGIKFGRHKLAPKVSPKKTVEGAVGGVVAGTLLMLLLSWAYGLCMQVLGTPVQLHYGAIAVFTPVFSLIGMLGDLSASVIKRCYHIKDFGKIMPGHGGIMDRFDSVLFTLPAVYILSDHISVVTLM